MLEAAELTRRVVNKTVVPERRGRGRREVVHMGDDEGNPIRPEVKPGSIRVSPQGGTTEKTGPEGGVPLPLIAGIIAIIVAVSAFVH